MMPIRALIVEDEPVARRGLSAMVAAEPGFQVLRECEDGAEAVRAIEELHPDVVLLDVQLPGLDAFEVVRTVGADRMPPIVFVTAYQQHAVQAFEVNAVDYLLKPVNEERLHRALARVVEKRESPDALQERLAALLDQIGREPAPACRFAVQAEGRILVLEANRIDWIEASGNYVRLHVGRRAHVVRETLTEVERKLPAGEFIRIHRSRLVNARRIRELHPLFHGEYTVVLEDGAELQSSRSYRTNIQAFLGNVPGPSPASSSR